MTTPTDRQRELTAGRARTYRRRRREGVLVVARVELQEKHIDVLSKARLLDGDDHAAAILKAIEVMEHYEQMCRIFRIVTHK